MSACLFVVLHHAVTVIAATATAAVAVARLRRRHSWAWRLRSCTRNCVVVQRRDGAEPHRAVYGASSCRARCRAVWYGLGCQRTGTREACHENTHLKNESTQAETAHVREAEAPRGTVPRAVSLLHLTLCVSVCAREGELASRCAVIRYGGFWCRRYTTTDV